jgi:spore coat polysaccharide biosynthesis predicted glycosyltransferase SpsG
VNALLLVAEASPALGAGHAMRLSAIADAARAAGVRAPIVLVGDAARVADALARAGHEVATADAASIARRAAELGAKAIVLDGPGLAAIAPALRERFVIAALDDGAPTRPPIPADLIVDPSFDAAAHRDRHAGARERLLGRAYALLRAPFLRVPHGGPAPIARPRLRVAVTFGGSDPLGATPRAVNALRGAPPLEIVAIAGPGFAHGAALDAALDWARRKGGHTVARVGPVDDMAALLASCDAAIAGAGGTLAELAYLGRPTAAYAVADDQVAIAAAQAAAGLVHGGLDLARVDDRALAADLARFLADPAGRAACAARAAATVDGRGAARVLAAISEMLG